jgi:hypothetical protein
MFQGIAGDEAARWAVPAGVDISMLESPSLVRDRPQQNRPKRP